MKAIDRFLWHASPAVAFWRDVSLAAFVVATIAWVAFKVWAG